MSETQDPINQRINFLIGHLEKGVRRRFALAIGVSAGMISDLFSDRKNKPGIDMVRKILTAYPQISTDWLLLGEGEMLKKEAVSEKIEEPQNNFSYKAQSAGENSVASGVTVGPPANYGGIAVPTFGPPPRKGKPKPVGMDLLEMVQQHQADIEALQQAMEALKSERALK